VRRAILAFAAAAAIASPARAQDLAQARAFVERLCAAYAREPGPDYLNDQAKAVFSPALLELMKREAAHTPKGEVGALDGDPICNCQDYKITGVQVAVAAAGPAKARADVAFRNFDQKQTVTLDLVVVAGQWSVDDIHEEGIPSLVGLLMDSQKSAKP
jgi:hypothetical protein